MKGDSQRVKRAAEAVGDQVKNQASSKMKGATKELLQKGQVPKDLLGMNDAMMEGIYGQGYRLYNTGKYRDASQLFRLLIMLNASEPKYIMGLAACFHMLKEYKSAVETYLIAAMVEPDNPVPHFHSSDCYMQMNNNISALVALEMAVKRAGKKPQYATLKDRALLTIQSLKKDISGRQEAK